MQYLLLGSDSLSKDEQLKSIKKQFLNPVQEQFNQDIFHGRDTALKSLQEAFMRLPAAGAGQRIIIIREILDLRLEAKDFILAYVQKPRAQITLVLEAAGCAKEEFIGKLSRHCKVFRFKEIPEPDTFFLSRMISARRTDQALKVLSQLLKNGERPERILGGLRYTWEKESMSAQEARNRLKLLVKADLEIKTGRLKPVFALEKLVVGLCALVKPLG